MNQYEKWDKSGLNYKKRTTNYFEIISKIELLSSELDYQVHVYLENSYLH